MNHLTHIYIAFLAAVFFSNDAAAAEKVKQTNNAPFSTSVSNSGSGLQTNFMVGSLFANASGADPIQLQKFLASLRLEQKKEKPRRDPLFIKLERYLVATNPTELQIASVSIQDWLGDTESSVTIEIANPSKLPAENVAVRILAPVEPGESTSKALVLKSSQSIPAGFKNAMYVPQNKNTSIPIGFVSDLTAALELSRKPGYTLLGVGTTADIPPVLLEKARQMAPNSAFETAGLGIELKYKTIFDQTLIRLFPLHFYFVKALRESADPG